MAMAPAATSQSVTRSARVLGARAVAAAGTAASARDTRIASATRSPLTNTSWISASTAAADRSRNCDVRRKISTSIVARPAQPRSSTTPNDVKVNRNTSVAALTIAGRASGTKTRVTRRQLRAPSSSAASSSCESIAAQAAPTTRTTTAMLKNTWAARIAATDPGSPVNAIPTTTVGSTNGTSTSASSACRPRNENREVTNAIGNPTAIVSAVETAACHRVNQMS